MPKAFPPAKRKRLAAAIPDGPALSESAIQPHRSKRLWMPYGDIILQAEATQFRVNRDVLARNSPVFREMFATQLPDQPTIEGCAIVILSDAAMDWELLLERLYDYQFQYESALPFDVVAALLRLGSKYHISVAKENAIWRIRHEFPAVLDLWDEVEAGIRMQKIQYRPSLLLDMLSLAYDGGVSSSVPILAACCLRTFDMATLLQDKIQREDGSYVVLSDPMKRALLNASERILEFELELFNWLEDDWVIPHEWCTTMTTCRQRRRELHGMFSMGQGEWRYNALAVWHADSEWGDGLCEVCEVAGRTRFNANRHRAWEALPGFLNLPPWGELKDLEKPFLLSSSIWVNEVQA
ncbi:hypothetical protein B0H16DRAFT_1337712 [Mycena metata]|uniref:BTB domain-containing protein n=1 Tax=Mycena metata TaxID=1033252 RepID=A0AAD7MIP5_9AGAR|nr:hypothetical protein B0H16DRAFT_1337712 [Mycena metata]